MVKLISSIVFISLSAFLFSQETGEQEILVTGKTVIFFSLAQSEFDALSEPERDEINVVLSDFDFYKVKILPFLTENQIKAIQTANPVITIKQGEQITTYTRSELNNVVGMILVDGTRKPKLELGVATDKGLMNMISNYFEIPKL